MIVIIYLVRCLHYLSLSLSSVLLIFRDGFSVRILPFRARWGDPSLLGAMLLAMRYQSHVVCKVQVVCLLTLCSCSPFLRPFAVSFTIIQTMAKGRGKAREDILVFLLSVYQMGLMTDRHGKAWQHFHPYMTISSSWLFSMELRHKGTSVSMHRTPRSRY